MIGYQELFQTQAVVLRSHDGESAGEKNPAGGLSAWPVTMGEYALQALADAFAGKRVNPVVDSDKIGPLPALVTKAELDAHPDFKGEWAQ
jgi:hypothetical protein